MATTIELGVQEKSARTPQPARKVNDFSIQVATVNEPAIAAYTKLGFVQHHRYLYLAPTH